MNFFIDLRYLFPPLVNLFSFLLFTSQGDEVEILRYPISKLPFLMLFLLLLLIILFLSTSIKLPLTAKPIRLRTGNFSVVLAMATLASIILSPSLFFVAYLFLMLTSFWSGILWSLFKRLFNWLRQSLQSVPTIFIICFTQNQENTEPTATDHQNVEEIGRLEVQGNFIQNRHRGLEQQVVVVIDG
ncbi:hypothetical protein ACOSP7_025396 [Xanthoceras sorbifolium]